MANAVDFPVFDADNHMYETTDAFTKFLPKEYEGLVKYVQVNGRTKIALRNVISDYIPNPTFEVVGRPGAQEAYFKEGNPEGKSRRELIGEAMRSPEGFFSPEPRLKIMDELGLDRALMWPTTPRRRTPWCTRSTSGCTSTGPSTTRAGSSRRRSSPFLS